MSIINNANPGSGLILLPLIERVLQSAQEPLSQDTLLARYRPDNLPANDNAWRKLKENLSFGAIWDSGRCSTERCYRLKQVCVHWRIGCLSVRLMLVVKKALPVGMIANRCGGY